MRNKIRQRRADYLTAVCRLIEEAYRALVALGAVATTSPADAAKGADFVFTNVTATADVESVLLGAGGVIETAASGTIVCDFSTIDATATRAIAAQLAERKDAFRDFREVLLEDSGHMMHHDQPERLAAIIENFLPRD